MSKDFCCWMIPLSLSWIQASVIFNTLLSRMSPSHTIFVIFACYLISSLLHLLNIFVRILSTFSPFSANLTSLNISIYPFLILVWTLKIEKKEHLEGHNPVGPSLIHKSHKALLDVFASFIYFTQYTSVSITFDILSTMSKLPFAKINAYSPLPLPNIFRMALTIALCSS